MQGVVLLGAAAALFQGAAAQVPAWGQCGGIGYSGSTTCLPGHYCKYQNDWYYQCVPGTDSSSSKTTTASTSSKPTTSSTSKVSTTSKAIVTSTSSKTTLVTVSTKTSSSATATATSQCTTPFKSITAQQYISNMDPGWNLGNTLDAPEFEGAWNNPPVVAATFDDVKAAGFKSVRIPTTWHYHINGTSPDWTIDPKWLQRVSDVLDMVTSRGMYALVNVHHDSWIWADVTQANANYTMIEEKFARIWYQVGQALGCKSEMVAFEVINEPPGSTAEHGAEINRLNEIFLKQINLAGGYNSKRVVTLSGAGQDSIKTSQWLKVPTGFPNPIAIQYHYYSPYDFVFGAWGRTIWGSDADKATLEADLANIRNNFTDLPLVVGEWGSVISIQERAARWRYIDFFVRTTRKYNTATILWDNGLDFLDRNTHTWRDQTALDIYINAQKGIVNSLPDSTIDGQATTQTSSAYIYHKVGDAIADQTLPFLFNGNTLKSIKYGTKTLVANTDYSVSGSNIVFASSFLSTVFSATDAPTIKGSLILSFSAGANIEVQIVQWDVATLASTTSKAVAGADLRIPVTWKGVAQLAAVKAVRADGVYLFDDWTQYLGPLQQARITYDGQWAFEGNYVILKASTINAVIAAGQTTTFTFEFYPRTPGNAQNYTLTV